MQSDFETIRLVDDQGKEYWSARQLCPALGYSAYYKFQRVVDKAIEVAKQKGMNVDDHFSLSVEMVQLGSGAFRKVDNLHLSRMACLIVAENADAKKPQVQMAREYFTGKVSHAELVDNYISSNVLLYKSNHGEVKVEVIFNNETFWMSQKRMAELFGVDVRTINYHLSQIYESGELVEKATIRKIGIVQAEGDRNVNRQPLFYNLDAIIAVGYRVNSYQATQFRIWATAVLKELIVKGFVLDDERLKQGSHFGKDYFDDLLVRIREIRTSERRYYQKITDIYSECSSDYDPKSEITRTFFATVQNMMHWAVSHQTAAEIIYNSGGKTKTFDGDYNGNLQDYAYEKSGINEESLDDMAMYLAKNYLSDQEVSRLELLTTAFLDFAEMRAERHLVTSMKEWKNQLDKFLSLNDYDILRDAGSVSAEQAQEKAYEEYDKYRLIQDREYLSDFDKEIKRLKGER